MNMGMEPGLYVVATPIGNLEDMTLRGLDVLRGVSLIVAEDTRMTRRLLDRYEIRKPMLSCHKFNEASRLGDIASRIRQGEAVALVSDSGMPVVSDPGARLVRACRENGVPVTCLPGPSAVTTAVALAGLPSGAFLFGGFLPVKPGRREKSLRAWMASGVPVVLFESPHRLIKLLDLLETIAPDVRIFIGRELTKKFEEALEGTAAELKHAFAGRAVKGEIVVIVGSDGEASEPDLNEPA